MIDDRNRWDSFAPMMVERVGKLLEEIAGAASSIPLVGGSYDRPEDQPQALCLWDRPDRVRGHAGPVRRRHARQAGMAGV